MAVTGNSPCQEPNGLLAMYASPPLGLKLHHVISLLKNVYIILKMQLPDHVYQVFRK